MKIYLAGKGLPLDDARPRTRRRLYSFSDPNLRDMQADQRNGSELAIDSGAFSVRTKGAVIKLENYIAFLHAHGSIFSWYANLDVIPMRDVDQSAQATWENQVEMERNGLKPVPVFHFGEDVKWLKKYLDNHKYIALGGAVGGSPGSKKKLDALHYWWDDLFDRYLTGDQGMPTVKIHLFGHTATTTLARYPLFSADSGRWLTDSGRGDFPMPPFEKGKPNFTCTPILYNVYREPPHGANSIWNLAPQAFNTIKEYVEAQSLALGESSTQVRPEATTKPTKARKIHARRPIHTRLNEGFRLERNRRWPETADLDGDLVPEEFIKVRGVCNDLELLRQLNAEYYHQMEDALPWPRPFRFKRRPGATIFD